MDSTAFKIVDSGIPHGYLLKFRTGYGAASTFIRPQEFYESPNKRVRGQIISFDEVLNRYADQKKGKMKYFSDWAGFNIRGDIFLQWYANHWQDLTENESRLESILRPYIRDNNPNFAIAGYVRGDKETKRHETAHMRFYLDPAYREHCRNVWCSMSGSDTEKVCKGLKKLGYATEDAYLVHDEFQAYFLTTKDSEYIKKHFGISQKPWKKRLSNSGPEAH